MMFVLALSGTANAAVYLWNGSAADGLWETPANWTVTDSTWTWPNEETDGSYVNSDVLGIDIIDGSVVERGDTLRIKGGDELTTGVLTLDNASSLTVSGRLSIGTDPDSAPRMGELNVLNGSILTILDGANGNDLYAADDPNTTGTINIVDSIVNVFDRIAIDEGDGTINITDSVIVAEDIYIGDGATGVGTMNVSGATTIDLNDDLLVGDDGVGTFNISGDSTLNIPDELYIANQVGSEGHMTMSGNAVVNVVDDVDVGDDGLGTLDISGNATLNIAGDEELYVATNEGSEGHLTISGNATVTIGDDLDIGTKGLGTCNISENATISCDDIELANEPTGVATMDISGNATVNVGDDIDLGKKGVGTLNISGDATLHVPDELYIGDDGGSEGHMTISGNATVTVVDDIDVGDDGSGTLDISGNATLNVEDSIKISENGGEGHMTVSGTATVNVDDDIEPSCSSALGTMDIGENATVNLGDDFELGVDAGGEGHLTISGNALVNCDDLRVGVNLETITSVTIDGGNLIIRDDLALGYGDGDPSVGQARIFMNGGLLQAEELSDIKITDTQIIYTGGRFRIGADDLDVAGMQQLVDDGTIVIPDETLVYGIVSNGIYTQISPVSSLIPQMPDPVDGAEGVTYGSSLRWSLGDTAATNDVYFGTTNPPAFAASVEGAPYYPGPLESGTTYYWQVDAVEADGTTKYSSDVWSFTATTKTKKIDLDISIATGSDDAEEDVGGSASFSIDLGSSDLEFMHDNDVSDPNDEQVVGLRFVDVGLPAGAAITSAYVQFDADDINNDHHVGDTYTLIEGELNPNPGTFEDEPNNITARPRTTSIVEWAPAQWMETHLQSPDEATSDISSIIQEIVDQDGWALGNALVLILSQDPANPSAGIREAESFDGAGGSTARRPRLHIEAGAIDVATRPSPANGAEGVPLDATLGWWPGSNAVSHDVYFDTSPMTPLPMPPYVVDGDSHSLPWVVANGTITFDGQIFYDGGDPDFISAGASGNSLDVPDKRNWANLSFDFDVDSVEFIYGGNAGNITVQAKDSTGAVIDSLSQADTSDRQPAGPVTFEGPGIRSLNWKTTSDAEKFAALDNIILTTVPPALLGSTTQISMDPGALAPSTTYYWQVDTIEADGTKNIGSIWSFTTVPGEATEPDSADKALSVALDKVLSWKPGATVATRDVYFGTTDPPAFIGNQEDPNFDPGPLEMETTYYWQVDEIEADGTTVFTGDVWSFKTPRLATGTILREVWEGIGGTSVSDLTGSADYPYNPTSSDELTSFDVPEFGDPGLGADFGSRLHGYLHPETSGDYTFWIASDDSSELWLSTDESPDNAVLISTVDGWTDHLDFDSGNATPSGPIPLEGGLKYYIMALYKEGGGGDNCAVAWEGPDSPARAVIHGYYLSPYVEFMNTKPDPADGTIEVSKTLTISWTPGGTAVSHDVYLSADSAAVSDGTAFITNQAETSYSPADLEKGATYYWRVDAVDADGTTYTSDVWSFTVTTLGR